MKVSDEWIKRMLEHCEEHRLSGESDSEPVLIGRKRYEALLREVQAARKMRDKHYNEWSDETAAYDRARAGEK